MPFMNVRERSLVRISGCTFSNPVYQIVYLCSVTMSSALGLAENSVAQLSPGPWGTVANGGVGFQCQKALVANHLGVKFQI